jgi:hypothetical protein
VDAAVCAAVAAAGAYLPPWARLAPAPPAALQALPPTLCVRGGGPLVGVHVLDDATLRAVVREGVPIMRAGDALRPAFRAQCPDARREHVAARVAQLGFPWLPVVRGLRVIVSELTDELRAIPGVRWLREDGGALGGPPLADRHSAARVLFSVPDVPGASLVLRAGVARALFDDAVAEGGLLEGARRGAAISALRGTAPLPGAGDAAPVLGFFLAAPPAQLAARGGVCECVRGGVVLRFNAPAPPLRGDAAPLALVLHVFAELRHTPPPGLVRAAEAAAGASAASAPGGQLGAGSNPGAGGLAPADAPAGLLRPVTVPQPTPASAPPSAGPPPCSRAAASVTAAAAAAAHRAARAAAVALPEHGDADMAAAGARPDRAAKRSAPAEAEGRAERPADELPLAEETTPAVDEPEPPARRLRIATAPPPTPRTAPPRAAPARGCRRSWARARARRPPAPPPRSRRAALAAPRGRVSRGGR